MWSDDEDGSSGSSLSGGTRESASSYSEVHWPLPRAAGDVGTSKSADMDLDDDAASDLHGLATPTQGDFYHEYMSEEEDEDNDMVGGAGAHVDILAVTNVLSQGIDLDDEFEPAGTVIPDQGHGGGNQPAALPAQEPEDEDFSPPFDLGAHMFQAAHNFDLEQQQQPQQQPPPMPMPTVPQFLVNGVQPLALPNALQDEPQVNPITNHHMMTGAQAAHNLQMLHPNIMSNLHGAALGPDNYNLSGFIRAWQNAAWQGLARERGRYPWPDKLDQQMSQSVMHVDYMDLEGDRYDVQGIDWEDLGVTRSEARERRLNTYKNYVNVPGSDRWEETQGLLPCTESYFRFRGLDVRKNINLAHFQLRNVLASTSRGQVFYPSQSSIHEFNPITGKTRLGMRSKEIPHFQVSTLAADHGTLVAGGFFGEYCFRRLSSENSSETYEGTITTDNSGITNHVQIHTSRTSSSPRAAFASNDRGFRVLDIETEKFVSETYFTKPVNCSAISPDGRLRAMVGDQTQVLIAKAEADGQPEVLKKLGGHGDYGFACAWADDGWTVATGFQDKSVKIWDARRWTDARGEASPVCTLRSEIAGVRSLRFSPLGSGKRVLVAAEEADFVNIYDARTFQTKQTFDFFGEIGGTSFVNDGQDLHVLCCDRNRGGLFKLERCGVGAERHHDPEDPGIRPYAAWKNGSYDWQEFKTTPRRLPRYSEIRRRRAIAPYLLQPF